MSKKLFLVILIVSIFFILSAVEGFAAVPQKMNFQGRLLNISNPGAPTPETGGKTVYFAIRNEADDITHWSSTQSVSCDSQGQFSTVLDLSVGQSGTNPLDFSKPLYLRVEYPVGSLLGPRQPLETVPYAFYAVTADAGVGSAPAGGWKDSGITVELVTPTDRVGIGTSYPAGALHVSSGASPNALVVKGGNVGIGTATPDATLDVKGTVHMIGTSTDYSSTYNSDHIAPSDGFVVVYVTASSGSNNLTMIGWTKDGPIDSYTPICGANANGDPTECSYYGGFSMPVRKGQYWKVTKEFSYGEYYGFKVRYFPIGHE